MDNTSMNEQIPVPQELLAPENINPYTNSEIVASLVDAYLAGNELKVAYLDVDSTLTSENENLDEAIKEQETARRMLKEAGYQIVFVSSRPLEMMASKEQVMRSGQYGFDKPHPKFNKVGVTTVGNIDANRDKGYKHEPAYPDEVPYFAGIINPSVAISNTGTEIWIHQQGQNGYALDTNFEKELGVDRATWRSETMQKVDAAIAQTGNKVEKALIEDKKNLDEGRIDVGPQDLRIQVNTKLKTPEGLQDQLAFMKELGSQKDLRIIEDGNPFSKPDLRFQMYITPEHAGKDHAVNSFFNSLMKAMNEKLAASGKQVSASDFQSLFVGDSFPDIQMGLYGAPGSHATVLYVGGSRLTSFIGNQYPENQQFHSENFTAINDRIKPLPEKGYYEYEGRTIIAGDEVFPNTKTAETIIQFLS